MEKPIGRLIFMLLLLVFVVLTSCNNGGRSKFRAENNIDFDTIRTEERFYLEGDTRNPYCDIKVDFIYPVSSSEGDLQMLQQLFVRSMFGYAFENFEPSAAVEAYVNNYVENYSQDAGTYKETVSDMKELNDMIPGMDIQDSEHIMSDTFYSYYESLSDSITFNQYDVISYQVKQSNSKGEPNSYFVSYNNYAINLKSGSQLTEADIFVTGYDNVLQGLIIDSLMKQNDVESIEELEDLGFFGIKEIVPNNNFLINDEGITYTFNKGEYSAYQLNAPEVFIPFIAIKQLIRENSIVGKLANL
ncbi:MAG TPA: RsiV family protein [Fermentimonas sp.]|nr:RsiV family protein [Fermentimonas sp.]